jgi:hypothetical protein
MMQKPNVWCYYDESGEHDAQGNLVKMAIGGCVSRLDKWSTLEREWQAALAEEGLAFFHMTDFEKWRPPFDFRKPNGNRDRQRHDRLLNKLLDIMCNQIEAFHGSFVETTGPKRRHGLTWEDCVVMPIKYAVEEIWDSYKEPIELVFSQQEHFPLKGIRAYVTLFEHGLERRINDVSFCDPKKVCALQAADIVAYEFAHAQRPGHPERYPLKKLREFVEAKGRPLIIEPGPTVRRYRFGPPSLAKGLWDKTMREARRLIRDGPSEK